MKNRYFLFAEVTPWYATDGHLRECYYNSVSGELKLRERIKEILEDEPTADIRVVWGDDLTDKFVKKSEFTTKDEEVEK